MADYQPYATKGMAGTALGLGIGGLGLNLLGSLLNAGRGLEVAGDVSVTPTRRYEMQQAERIAKLETELAFERSVHYTDNKSDGLEKQIFALQREIDHMKAVYVPGKLVMPQSSVVTIPATAAPAA
jgi:hypothetical protein